MEEITLNKRNLCKFEGQEHRAGAGIALKNEWFDLICSMGQPGTILLPTLEDGVLPSACRRSLKLLGPAFKALYNQSAANPPTSSPPPPHHTT